jgi:ATP-dependent Zn protease
VNSLTRGLASLLLALVMCLAPAIVISAAEAAEGTISYQHESESDFAKQLAAGEVKAVTINKRVRTMRTTLADGRHVLARYPKHEEPQVAARLKAKGVEVAVLNKALAEKQAAEKKPVHHKLRYIAGGVLIVVILIVVAVLVVNRRRRQQD